MRECEYPYSVYLSRTEGGERHLPVDKVYLFEHPHTPEINAIVGEHINALEEFANGEFGRAGRYFPYRLRYIEAADQDLFRALAETPDADAVARLRVRYSSEEIIALASLLARMPEGFHPSALHHVLPASTDAPVQYIYSADWTGIPEDELLGALRHFLFHTDRLKEMAMEEQEPEEPIGRPHETLLEYFLSYPLDVLDQYERCGAPFDSYFVSPEDESWELPEKKPERTPHILFSLEPKVKEDPGRFGVAACHREHHEPTPRELEIRQEMERSRQIEKRAQTIRTEIEQLQLRMGLNLWSADLEAAIMAQLQDKPIAAAGPLVVDDDFSIRLSGIGMTIPIATLPKALFFLFLRHPEGIRREDLGDYEQELRQIYLTISTRENVEKLQGSIADLTDPFSGSLNQKISRVNAAFSSRLAPDVAELFMIQGPRGEKKSVRAAADARLPEVLRF